MKKILAIFSAVTFFSSATLAVSACGPSKGSKIEVVTKDAPEKAKTTQDPLSEYVYNDKFNYSKANVNYAIAVSAQLASDKIRKKEQTDSELWKEFYNSPDWQRGSFKSFHYEPEVPNDANEKKEAFSFRGSGDQEFIYSIKGKDINTDDNKLRMYWFVTSATAGGKPDKNNIVVPDPNDFDKDKKTITRTGWIHLYLLIGAYRIDFNVELNFNFTTIKIAEQRIVMLEPTSFSKPLGNINWNNPPYDKVLNLAVSKPTTPPPSK